MGYLDFAGIWTPASPSAWLLIKNGPGLRPVRAGIVADSVPEKEFQECQNMARRSINAQKTAEGGLK